LACHRRAAWSESPWTWSLHPGLQCQLEEQRSNSSWKRNVPRHAFISLNSEAEEEELKVTGYKKVDATLEKMANFLDKCRDGLDKKAKTDICNFWFEMSLV